MRGIDLTSWGSLLTTLVGLALVTLIGVGIRLLVMVTVQRRRERLNRQINERLRTLIAAYKTLGGSFTGDLAVDPTHRRDLRDPAPPAGGGDAAVPPEAGAEAAGSAAGSDRARRIRDAVEAALSDIILLGTEEQVRLAAGAAQELVAGRPVHMHGLVTSLRDFIRAALDLDPVPPDLALPAQGPTRPPPSGGRGRGGDGGDGGRGGGERSGERGGGGSGGGMGGGMGIGIGAMGGAEEPPAVRRP